MREKLEEVEEMVCVCDGETEDNAIIIIIIIPLYYCGAIERITPVLPRIIAMQIELMALRWNRMAAVRCIRDGYSM